MTIVRVGSNKKFADGWDNIFKDDAKSSAKKAKAKKKTTKKKKK